MSNSHYLLSMFNIRRVIIFLYGISICFGTFALGGSSRNFTISFILAILYIPLILLDPRQGLWNVIRKYKSYILPMFFFMVLIFIMNVFNANEYDVPMIPISIVSCFLFFIVMLLHNEYDNQAVHYCICGFCVGAIILSVLFLLDIGVYVEQGIMLDEEERMSMFGQNQNELGLIMVCGITLVLMAILKDRLRIGFARYLLILPTLSMMSLLLASASRAAFTSLVLIVILIILCHRTNGCFSQILFFAVSIGLCLYGLSYIETSEVMYERIMLTLKEGNTSGRTEIWEALLPRLIETPIFGVGQTGYADVAHKELVGVTSVMHESGYSPHNVLIEVFAYTGIVGLSLVLIFWTRIVRDSMNIFKKLGNLMPLLLLIPIGIYILTGQILTDKLAWLIYAFIIVVYSNYKGALCKR